MALAKGHHLLNMNVLGLITARGGSKSIPYKNIAPLGGRPLIAYAADAALHSTQITRVILSTDDEKIAQVGRECGIDVPFMRPAELASDTATSLSVAQHAIRWLADQQDWQTDIVVILQPTSPFRTSRHLDEALTAMIAANADTVVSVVEVPHHFSPYKLMNLNDGRLTNFWDQPLPSVRRQDVPRLYARNGPAILGVKSAVVLERASFYGDHIIPYLMNESESIDIDTPFDLKMAEWLLSVKGTE